MIADLTGKLITAIMIVLIGLSICITVDFADDSITVNENMTEIQEQNCTLINGTYYSNEINANKSIIRVTSYDKVHCNYPTITITAKPSCSCGKHYSYRWRTRTFVNYCPHCHRYNALVNKHKYPARHEQELTCKYDDCDYCGNCGKEKYSWSNYRLKKV